MMFARVRIQKSMKPMKKRDVRDKTGEYRSSHLQSQCHLLQAFYVCIPDCSLNVGLVQHRQKVTESPVFGLLEMLSIGNMLSGKNIGIKRNHWNDPPKTFS